MMKILTLLILITLLFSCNGTTEIITEYIEIIAEEPIVDDPRLIGGSWVRNNLAWIFYDDMTFRYFEIDTGNDLNTGIYNADPAAGTIYIEDPGVDVNQTYIYDVLVNIPPDGYTLRWATVAAPELTVDWVKF